MMMNAQKFASEALVKLILPWINHFQNEEICYGSAQKKTFKLFFLL